MEVTIDSFMNFGMVPSLFMVFNIVNRLDFKSTPITLILKSSQQSPLGSRALPVFKSWIPYSNSFMERSGLLFAQASDSLSLVTS